MLIFLNYVLAVCILVFFFKHPFPGLILGGLLGVVVYLSSSTSALKRRVQKLEEQLSEESKKGERKATVAKVPATPPEPQADAVHEQKSAPTREPEVASTGETKSTPTREPEAPSTSEPKAPPVREPEVTMAHESKAPSVIKSSSGEVSAQRSGPSEASKATSSSTPPRKQEKPPSQPPRQQPPSGPSLAEKLFTKAWQWFTEGNVFVRVGVVVLFLGVSFLLRYAFGENMIPISVTLSVVAAGGLALLYWGWRQRDVRSNFSLVIQGGGIGIVYLTVFAAFGFYDVIPSLPAFLLLGVIVALAAALAVLQDARSLALFATVGGFLAPILTSSGSNNYIGLFSYYTLLNIGIFAIAWFRSWRLLNLVGFVFTFVVSATWGALSYEKAFFATTEPFLVVFFLLYVGISILFANRQTPFYKDYVDGSLVFGTPLLAFGLQCSMVSHYEYGIAASAAVLGCFYILLARFVWSRYRDSLKLLAEAFLSLGVIFLTLAIPFAIDGRLTGATWAIEGAGILWVSIRQQQKYRRFFGEALVVASGLIMVNELFTLGEEPGAVFAQAFINSAFIGCVIIALSGSICSWLLSRPFVGRTGAEKDFQNILLAYGLFILAVGFEYQVIVFELLYAHGNLMACLLAVCMLIYTVAGDRLQWQQAHWVSAAMVAPVGIAALLSYAYQPRLSAEFGYIVWPLTLSIGFYSLRRALTIVHPQTLTVAHAYLAVVAAGLLFWEGLWQLLLVYSLLTVFFNLAVKRWDWPQLKLPALGFLAVLVVCAVAAIAIDGDLVTLSGAGFVWPFPPGYVLWPFGFAVYFHVLRQNPTLAGYSTAYLHYSGAGLIAGLLLWLGLWPLLLAASLLALLCHYLWERFSWEEMRITSMGLLPLMVLTTLIESFSGPTGPFSLQAFNVDYSPGFEPGYALWPLAFTALFIMLRRYDVRQFPVSAFMHGGPLLLAVFLVTWGGSSHLLDYIAPMNSWHLAFMPVATLVVIWLIMAPPCWPFTQHRGDYLRTAVWPLTMVLVLWSLFQLNSAGDPSPLPWVPLLNPVDIVQAIIVMAALSWFGAAFSIFSNPPSKRTLGIVMASFVFLWTNVELLRVVHHWGGVSWEPSTILTADLSQTALSIFWTLCGVVTTFYAGRRHRRRLWLVGSALLGVVVVKLFLVDLAASDTVERIVSFTGVGLLLVVVGYLSPLPPKKVAEHEQGGAE